MQVAASCKLFVNSQILLIVILRQQAIADLVLLIVLLGVAGRTGCRRIPNASLQVIGSLVKVTAAIAPDCICRRDCTVGVMVSGAWGGVLRPVPVRVFIWISVVFFHTGTAHWFLIRVLVAEEGLVRVQSRKTWLRV